MQPTGPKDKPSEQVHRGSSPSSPSSSLVKKAGTTIPIGSFEILLEALRDPKTKASKIQDILTKHFNPEDFIAPEFVVGNEQPSLISSRVAIAKLFEHIQNYGSLFPAIRFRNCTFTVECQEQLVASLGGCHHVKSLFFEKSSLREEEQTDILMSLLCLNNGLEEFGMIHNFHRLTSKLIEPLQILLESPNAPSSLTLSFNGIDDDFIESLVVILSQNQTVHTLNLDGNKITKKGAMALAGWINTRPQVRRCSLVYNQLVERDWQDVEKMVESKPSPFVFLTAPLPEVIRSADQMFFMKIIGAKKYTTEQLKLFAKIQGVARKKEFERWLEIGFNIHSCPVQEDQAPTMTFFKAILMGTGLNIPLFEKTMEYVSNNIVLATEQILSDFPTLENPIENFQLLVANGEWPEKTFKWAIQKVLGQYRISRPIYIYTPTILPEITPEGELLPHPEFRLEEAAKIPSNPIYLYFDGEKFSLLRKKKP